MLYLVRYQDKYCGFNFYRNNEWSNIANEVKHIDSPIYFADVRYENGEELLSKIVVEDIYEQPAEEMCVVLGIDDLGIYGTFPNFDTILA